MTDLRLPASGNIMVRWHPANAFANPYRPTPTELNAGLVLVDAISWNDLSFGVEASTTINDPALSAKSATVDRGSLQYGGAMSFYFPAADADNSNLLKQAQDALENQRTLGYISMSIDGELSENATPLYTGGATRVAQTGDLAHVFKVMTAGEALAITGEESFRYTITFLPQGEAAIYTVVGTTSTVEITPATLALAAGDVQPLEATVDGRAYTRGLRWTTSDPDVATVSQNGIVTAVGAGTATITATFRHANTSDTCAVTVS